jgi:hypothetical protein
MSVFLFDVDNRSSSPSFDMQVFCFPCILHYLGTSENTKWARCPICFDSINEKQLKSVHWFTPPSHLDSNPDGGRSQPSSSLVSADDNPAKTPKPGSTLCMRLMQRPQITTLALPRSSTWPSDLLPPHQAPFHFLPDVYTYAKFMLATPSYLIENLTRDLSELGSERRTLSELGDELGIEFCDAVEQRLNAQIAQANALDSDTLHAAIDRAVQLELDIATRAVLQAQRKQEREGTATSDLSDVPMHYLSTQTLHPPAPLPTQTSRGPKSRKNLNPPPSTSAYYFYQAASGLPIFLHPLDIRILSSYFGAYAAFPDCIAVRVEAASEGSVDADLRRRCKYLSHIPEGADVVFIEADLEGVVGAEGLRAFEGAIKARRGRRREKGRRDEKARARAEEREREKLVAISASAPSRTESNPAWITHELEPEQEHEQEMDRDTSSRAASPSPSPAPRAQQQQQQNGVWGARSFAAAANAGRGRGGGTTSQSPRVARPRPLYDGEGADPYANEDADDWVFGLDLDRAWHELQGQQRGSNGNGNGGGGGGGGGRRRRARMVVLGSGGAHGAGRRR